MRSTGRTFRMLLEAMLKLSEGHNVVVIADRDDYANALSKEFLSIGDELKFKNMDKKNRQTILTFVNDKVAVFMSRSAYERANSHGYFSNHEYYCDHYDSEHEKLLMQMSRNVEQMKKLKAKRLNIQGERDE